MVQTDALDSGELNTVDEGQLDDTTRGKENREDSISDLLFLYNITFLSDSKVSSGNFYFNVGISKSNYLTSKLLYIENFQRIQKKSFIVL